MKVTIQQVERLLDEGFTKSDIMNLFTGEVVSPAEPAEPAEPAKDEPPKETEQKETPSEPNKINGSDNVTNNTEDMSELNKRLDNIENSITGMIKTLQLSNLRNDSFGGMPDSLENQTDKIMAGIIRPETGKGGNQ